MKPASIPSILSFALLGLAGNWNPANAQDLTQTFTLQPGWNAIYLEVDLPQKNPAILFTNLPISSAWAWRARVSATDFIQDPSEAIDNGDKWLMYFPPARTESRFNTLFALKPRQAYLIKVEGSAPVVLSWTGRPSLRRAEWAPNTFNLRGFPVDSAAPPSFQNFFKYSLAHYTPSSSRLQAIYRLLPAGRWELVLPGDLMKRGEAYWVFTQGPSTYNGPFEVDLASRAGDGLDFGLTLDRIDLVFHNHTDRGALFSMGNLLGGDLPLSYFVFPSAGPGMSWLPLPATHQLPVNAFATSTLQLGVRRSAFNGAQYRNVIAVKDNLGTLHYVPMAAEKITGAATASSISSLSNRRLQAPGSAPLSARRGLWVGSVTLNAVSEPHAGSLVTNLTADGGIQVTRAEVSSTPTPAPAGFDLRLLVHVSDNGTARLLKEVTILQQPATFTNNSAGDPIEAQAAYEVLLTAPELIPAFSVLDSGNNAPRGRRLSTAHFDFDHQQTFLDMTGLFGTNSLSCTNQMDPLMPTNPFRHKYHPDHTAPMSYGLVRVINLDFPTEAHPSADPLTQGYDSFAGNYQERIRGLHKNDLFVAGTFKLKRVSQIGILNPAPAASSPTANQ